MTEPHKAKLAFLSSPSPSVHLVNLQFENGANLVVELSIGQVVNFVVDGATALRAHLVAGVGK